MVKLHITGARHEDADAWEGGRHSCVHRISGSEPRCLRTHRLSGQSRQRGSVVVEYQAPSTWSDSNFAQRPVW